MNTRKRIILRLLLPLSLVLLLVGEAFAQRTGGRVGGRGGFSRPAPTAPRSPSGGYGGGGYTGPVFLPFPIFGGGYGGACGGGAFSGVAMLLLVYFFFIRPTMRRAQHHRRSYGGYDHEEEDYRQGPASVYSLDLALRSTAARDLQKRLVELGASEDTSTQAGLARLLRETSLALTRRKEEIAGASFSREEPLSRAEAERRFEARVSRARSRYEVDTFSAEEGKVRRAAAPEGTGREGILEYLVVSLVVATADKLPLPARIQSQKELEEALHQLSSVPGSQLLALEVVWTPADPNDTLTGEDLALKFPELVTF